MEDSLMVVSSGSALMKEDPEVGGEAAMVGAEVEEMVAEDTEEEEMTVATVEEEMEGETETEEGDAVILGTDVAPGLAATPVVVETGVMTETGGTGARIGDRVGAGQDHRI